MVEFINNQNCIPSWKQEIGAVKLVLLTLLKYLGNNWDLIKCVMLYPPDVKVFIPIGVHISKLSELVNQIKYFFLKINLCLSIHFVCAIFMIYIFRYILKLKLLFIYSYIHNMWTQVCKYAIL